ncbi:thiosulfate oxidation carrier protein SoxY [Paracoccus sp. S3-43]|uniref:thiosulfate oxidation carrier protein SoxY n=1 Tax=Paracoccus sp. S3-43 TaxID=3030011 RepID=UPI003182FC00
MKAHILAALLLAGPAAAQDNPLKNSPAWDDLRDSVLSLAADVPQDAAVLDLDAPVRAHEAAIVPIRLTQPADAPPVQAVTLVIDENPAPWAAARPRRARTWPRSRRPWAGCGGKAPPRTGGPSAR